MATTTSTAPYAPDADLTDSAAVRLAAFALACLTSDDDYDPVLEPMYQAIDERGEEALDRLDRIYEQKRRIEQLTESIMSDEPVPCICGRCNAVDAALEAPTC